MFNIILYVIVGILLVVSFYKNKSKTILALKRAWKSFESMLPQFICLCLIIMLMLSFINEEIISRLLGQNSGLFGIIIAGAIGSIIIVPTMIAFPLAAELLKLGAGYSQITMLITSLTMIGIITLPFEKEYFGYGVTIKRNALAFIVCLINSLIVAIIM